MKIKRLVGQSLLKDAQGFRVLALLGPRQSGKTTLARMTFPDYRYASLEDPDTLLWASEDPRDFLNELSSGPGVILDEFQKFPELLSYLQGIIDENPRPGFFVLTGSQNFLMNRAITQTLAGRISIHTLLPFSLQELKANNLLNDLFQTLYQGCYPPIYTQDVEQNRWYTSYIQTYLERDVRDLKLVNDLSTFQRFVKLCAGRIGQILNLSSLANDCGISPNTAKAWISILEASYIIFLLQPHHKNFSKRLIKAPKLYFYDTGLVSALLNITQEQLNTHYLRGGLFEAMVLSEFQKTFYNNGMQPSIYFWRDHVGHEVDCIIEKGLDLIPVEIKSGKTISNSYFDGLCYWNELAAADPKKGFVIYAGNEAQARNKGSILPWDDAYKAITSNASEE